ncbi:DUF4214 domain-containing protein [Actinotalea subterranea]|uniref:DUF4214 domain-containing protein n=1 Tax=Actinotalea subterranea TaxID=2607497 RepID=UPI00165D3346|nr:DUF4214 domain-containing protein [Actinotalea subterranea]
MPHLTLPSRLPARGARGALRAAVAAAVVIGAVTAAGPATALPAGTPSGVAAVAQPTRVATAAGDYASYVVSVYRDLFGREPDAAGLNAWSAALNAGAARVGVANSITGSDEYRGGLITGSYAQYLSRTPDAPGLQNWLLHMNRGLTLQQMEGGFLASDEYYVQSGSTPAGWVTRLYQHVLGREAAGVEINHWASQLEAGTTRVSVAMGFLLSAEHVGAVLDVQYRKLLGRPLDDGGRAAWVSAIQSGSRIEAVIGSIVSSSEYVTRTGSYVPATPAPPVAAPPAPAPAPPAPAPGGGTAPAPSVGGPGGLPVGVPAGTHLTVHTGDLTITTPGTVIDSLDIRGFVRVRAANVTIRNSIIRGRGGLTSYMSLVQSPDAGANLVIENSELVALEPSPYIDGIVGKSFTLRGVNIHGVVDQVKITGNDVLVENSWLHGNLHYAQDPNYGYTPTHDDNVQIQVGSNITIRNTTMADAHNAGVQITQDRGTVSNVVFSSNRADGGACTINVAEKAYGPIGGMVISNNTFGLNTRVARCAILMPATTTALSTVASNIYVDGAVVAVKRG